MERDGEKWTVNSFAEPLAVAGLNYGLMMEKRLELESSWRHPYLSY
jgi:hypothetical protein